ncbi:alpha-N-arabinofuranosidase [Bryocella elongata]|uniref:non-reducing end alpha-L-arabinofuranosidase n=1 Tax=Bryocella elongata TaxID=863522 RepID=A0A1H6ALS5_9BACT|nr:alpha-L-arabinofuranosidase C-terminal domain-containing protein [Bryocella elongata]SEG49037.1 alpha-N-arabinofuranosidase [Bryocella elongata]
MTSKWLGVMCASVMMASPAAGFAQESHPDAAKLTIDVKDIVHPVSPMLYGLMTEEINHSYEGGLYAELISNRTFRGDWAGLQRWEIARHGNAEATLSIDKTTGPSAALNYSAKLVVASATESNVAGLGNPGWWGIGLKAHTEYKGSFYAKSESLSGPLTVKLIGNKSGLTMAETKVDLKGGDWKQYTYTLKTGSIAASAENHIEFTVSQPGTLWLQSVSLMPPTYANRENGNRIDLMEKMAAMKPTFIRLPGGNYLEGDKLQDWYDFKETIGPLVDRPGHQAPWSYWSTDGFGLLEFLEWCEDLKVEPVLAVYAGYSLKGEHVKAGKDLEPYVQAALDEVEYVTGDVSTKWGAERAKDGHPKPFPLHYIEVGNEDWLDHSGSYKERWPQFARALHTKYPQYKLIATEPVKATDKLEEPEVVDDHYYKHTADMLDFTKHYDDAPRTGPKIFVGEWATLAGSPTPNFGAALADSAWMTSMERNSDLIIMSAYAPLLVNVNPQGSQWGTNLIGFDAQTSFGSPSYYAQVMFAEHLGDGVPKSTITEAGPRFYYSATVDSKTSTLHLKFVNASDKEQPLEVELTGLTGLHVAKLTSLHGASYEATNTITEPSIVRPLLSSSQVQGSSWSHTVPALTIQTVDVVLK